MIRTRRTLKLAVLSSALLGGWFAPRAVALETIDFNRQIRPILSLNCTRCHGPDEKKREAGLRFDVRDSAVAMHDGHRAISPGEPNRSEMIRRISATDADEQMPPPPEKLNGGGKKLTPEQIDLITRWIKQGAPYAPHWAYVKPIRPPVPAVANKSWPKNDIDRFLLARLEKEKLPVSPEADRYALVRRLSLDLTGLPPTMAEVDRFVNDKSPDAYEKWVDELLARPSYGEHWARVWLDLARYADSGGYVSDEPREIWAYRDYVIRSFNADKPYDQFTIEQLAGDMLPNATEEQIIATAFHRNTPTNTEGGSNPEEYRNVAIVDRVNTTMSVWMGTTMRCAQCHDHKYDPISQKEYFQFFAILNNTEDAGRADEQPRHSFYTDEQKQERNKLQGEIAALEKKVPADEQFPAQTPAKGKKKGGPMAIANKLTDKRAGKLAAAQSPAKGSPAGVPPLGGVGGLIAVPPKGGIPTPAAMPAKPGPKTDDGKRLAELKTSLAAIKPFTVPVQKELPPGKRRTTTIEYRGNYLDRGPQVTEGVPAAFNPIPAGTPVNRLTMARWLVDPNNPLVARVTVNRLWEKLFGIGIVSTSEDFGTQGELPVHPELLDYLATEFVASHWDIKHMIRVMVTSAAYRQSSRVTPQLAERDPDNRLLARGPRFRLDAEGIRDQALDAAGLLSLKMYGPSVRPFQPSFGLSTAFGHGMDWTTSAGDDRYRRAIYTSWHRTNPYPSMVTFDEPSREDCCLRRPRTNTPLQALVTLNDPVYVEAAQALARRMEREGGATVADKVRYGFRLCLARPASDAETARLVQLFEQAVKRYSAKPAEAKKLAKDPIAGGPMPSGSPVEKDPVRMAAWTTVGNVLLNLDETLMRP